MPAETKQKTAQRRSFRVALFLALQGVIRWDCNSRMILRRLLAWFRWQRTAASGVMKEMPRKSAVELEAECLRLAVIMHRIWVDGTEFQWTREVTAA
jgi:hypothetical protein